MLWATCHRVYNARGRNSLLHQSCKRFKPVTGNMWLMGWTGKKQVIHLTLSCAVRRETFLTTPLNRPCDAVYQKTYPNENTKKIAPRLKTNDKPSPLLMKKPYAALELIPLPTNLSSRVLSLQEDNRYCSDSQTGYRSDAHSTIGTSRVTHSTKRIKDSRDVFIIVQFSEKSLIHNGCEAGKHLIALFQQTKIDNAKKHNKDVAPADDPKQKIKVLHRKIKQELPMFFDKGGPWNDFSIYTPRMELHVTPKNRKDPYIFRGLPSYKRLTWSFRTLAKLYLRFPSMDVLSATCFEDKKTIEVRWRVLGVPRYLIPFALFFPSQENTFKRSYDYMSVLYATEGGKIWRHDISKVRPLSHTVVGRREALRKYFGVAAVTPFVRKPTPT